jgi:hypothetical protein
MKDVLPVGVIIYEEDHIYFSNKETQKILRIKDQELNKQNLKALKKLQSQN